MILRGCKIKRSRDQEIARSRDREIHARLSLVLPFSVAGRTIAATDMLQDLRDAWRSLSAAKTVAVAAVLSLALGIAATTAVFSLLFALLFRPLPVVHPE